MRQERGAIVRVNSTHVILLKKLHAKKTPEKLRSTIAAVVRSRNRQVDSMFGENLIS